MCVIHVCPPKLNRPQIVDHEPLSMLRNPSTTRASSKGNKSAGLRHNQHDAPAECEIEKTTGGRERYCSERALEYMRMTNKTVTTCFTNQKQKENARAGARRAGETGATWRAAAAWKTDEQLTNAGGSIASNLDSASNLKVVILTVALYLLYNLSRPARSF